ncbi:NADPH:quinone reductase-like Zn-dependent oxidoreductase [Bradyrhizobium sp. AZCC 1678]|uniref:alcohol dehydrogenase catalytic domain-containing protein n=1 Tax=Bradyrhizobium sp. AZCC 1678 TaxID=3117030 RepID=UPI002FF37E7E
MRAFVLDGYGAIADQVRLAEIADPVPGPDDVRIEIHAASLNPIDFKIVHGDLKRVSKYQLPRPFGFDASGFAAARRADHGADVRACRCEVRTAGQGGVEGAVGISRLPFSASARAAISRSAFNLARSGQPQ